MKKLWILAALCLLCACSTKDYTQKDAEAYVKKLGVKNSTCVGEKAYDRETLWTFKEDNDRGLEFHVLEHLYEVGIDSSFFESTGLVSDYDSVVFRAYAKEKNLSTDMISCEDDMYDDTFKGDVTLKYTFSDRKTLKDAIREVEDLNKDLYAWAKTCNKSHKNYDINAYFSYTDNSMGSYASTEKIYDVSDLDDEFLLRLMVWYDEDGLKAYSSSEQKKLLTSNRSRILVDGELTDVMTFRGNTCIYNRAFYHLLEEEGFSPEGTPESFTLTGADGNTWGPFDRKVGFLDASAILGKEVTGEWQ